VPRLAPAGPHLEQEHEALVTLDLLLAKDDLLQAAVAGRAPQLLRSNLQGEEQQQGMLHELHSMYSILQLHQPAHALAWSDTHQAAARHRATCTYTEPWQHRFATAAALTKQHGTSTRSRQPAKQQQQQQQQQPHTWCGKHSAHISSSLSGAGFSSGNW
jgi:hypothetical protein